MNRRLSIVALALLVFSCGGLAAASPATAERQLYHVVSCTSDGTPNQQAGYDWYSPVPMRECPNPGLRLGFGVIASPGWIYPWQYNTGSSEARVRDVVMDVDRGEWGTGIEYSLARCSDTSCDPVSVLAEDNDGEWTVTGVDSSDVWLRAICRQESCVPADPPMPGTSDPPLWDDHTSWLAVSNIRMIIEDVEPPRPNLSANWPADFLDPWIKPGIIRRNASVLDFGSGVGSAKLTISRDGSGPQDRLTIVDFGVCAPEPGYSYEEVRICPGGVGVEGSPLDLREMPDGRYTSEITATDAVGNVMAPQSTWFGIDGTPPQPLEGVHAVIVHDGAPSEPLNEFGWTHESTLRLFWDHPSLQPGDAGAPLVQPDVDAVPVGGTTGPGPEISSTYRGATAPFTFRSEGRWRVRAWNRDDAGNLSDPEYVLVGHDTDLPEPAEPDPIPWLSADALRAGVDVTWDAPPVLAHLESGVCGYAVGVSEDPGHAPEPRFDVRAPATSYRLRGDFAEGDHHFALRTVSCAGVGSIPVDTPLNVDATAPIATLRGAEQAGWLRETPLIEVSGSDPRSGVESVWHANGGAPRVETAGSTAAFTLPDGVHSLSFGARDRAGNRSDAQTRVVMVDSAPPAAVFEPRDPETPAELRAVASDATSGVEDAWIEVRPLGGADAAWRSLPTSATGGAGRRELHATLPDSLADGPHELRVIAVDAAGNVTDGRGVRLSDAAMTVTMPVRQRVKLTAEVAPVTRSKRSKRCKRRPGRSLPKSCAVRERIDRRAAGELMVVDHPGRAALVGELATRSGRPVAGAELEVIETPKFGDRARVLTVVTGRNGSYTLPLATGPGRNYRVQFKGDATRGSARDDARLRVRAGVSLRISPRRARAGGRTVFRVELRGAKWQPEGGARVEIEYYNGLRWAPAVGAANADARGRLTIRDWSPSPVVAPVRHSFRAHVPRAFGWPYEDGYSDPATLIVLP